MKRELPHQKLPIKLKHPLRKIKQKVTRFFAKIPRITLTGYFKEWFLKDEYLQRYPAKWHLSIPSQEVKWKKPKLYGSQKINFKTQLVKKYPEMGILEIQRGIAIGENGWITDKNDVLIPEFSIFGVDIANLKESVKLPQEKKEIKLLSGSCLSLVSTWSGNYYHFLLDSIPRLFLYQKTGLSTENLDWLYCPSPKSKNSQSLLDQIGIASSKMVFTDDCFGVQADTLYAASFPGSRRNCPRWVIQYLREITDLPNLTPNRRLYVTRGKWSRKLLNEREVFRILEDYGFEFYNPDEHNNQPLDFNQADIIVAPHGAALANLVFCQPGTRFFEIIPTDHPFAYFYTLSQSAQLRYSYMVGDSIHVRRNPKSVSRQDFSVGLETFCKAVADVVANIDDST